ITSRATIERPSAAKNRAENPHFLDSLQKNAVRSGCVVVHAVYFQRVSAPNSRLAGKIQRISSNSALISSDMDGVIPQSHTLPDQIRWTAEQGIAEPEQAPFRR